MKSLVYALPICPSITRAAVSRSHAHFCADRVVLSRHDLQQHAPTSTSRHKTLTTRHKDEGGSENGVYIGTIRHTPKGSTVNGRLIGESKYDKPWQTTGFWGTFLFWPTAACARRASDKSLAAHRLLQCAEKAANLTIFRHPHSCKTSALLKVNLSGVSCSLDIAFPAPPQWPTENLPELIASRLLRFVKMGWPWSSRSPCECRVGWVTFQQLYPQLINSAWQCTKVSRNKEW